MDDILDKKKKGRGNRLLDLSSENGRLKSKLRKRGSHTAGKFLLGNSEASSYLPEFIRLR